MFSGFFIFFYITSINWLSLSVLFPSHLEGAKTNHKTQGGYSKIACNCYNILSCFQVTASGNEDAFTNLQYEERIKHVLFQSLAYGCMWYSKSLWSRCLILLKEERGANQSRESFQGWGVDHGQEGRRYGQKGNSKARGVIPSSGASK